MELVHKTDNYVGSGVKGPGDTVHDSEKVRDSADIVVGECTDCYIRIGTVKSTEEFGYCFFEFFVRGLMVELVRGRHILFLGDGVGIEGLKK